MEEEEIQGVSRAELSKVLSFTYYDEAQWETLLESEISDMVTYENLPYLYEQLGLSSLLDDIPSGSGTVEREDFYTMYAGWVDLLDTDHIVTIRDDLTLYPSDDALVDQDGNVYLFDLFTLPEGLAATQTIFIGDTLCGIGRMEEISSEEETTSEEQTQIAKISDIPDSIRVLLKGSGTDIWQESAILSSTNGMYIDTGKKKKKIKAGKSVDLSSYFTKKVKKITVTSKSTDGRISLNAQSAFSSYGNYQGTIEVYKKDGEYCFVNELSLEQYLYGVISSEMPSDYETEALRAQAVCARSYAAIQVSSGKLLDYDTNLDDTVSYQAYNHQEPSETVIQAVKDTEGIVITYGQTIVSTYFFSTSCGMTSDLEIWGADDTSDYLVCARTDESRTEKDFSDEDTFAAFLKETPDSYDSDYPYYRWTGSFSISDDMISYVYDLPVKVSSENITAVTSDGSKKAGLALDELTGIKSIAITKRAKSGCATELTIRCENGKITIRTENLIRYFLGHYVQTVKKADGKQTGSFKMLPSGYFVIEKTDDNRYNITGGGFGHGIGMSQTAANEMAKSGMTYPEILSYFYKNTELANIGQNE
jgi:stage II sporulation protein D